MAKMLVAYFSRTGHTKRMAEVVADGARSVGGLTVDCKPVKDLVARVLLDYDAIALGSPTYYGSMAAEMKRLLDDSVAFHGQLEGKIGGAFTSSGNIGGGNETTLLSLLEALLIHGMIVQGTSSGDHYGPVAIGDVDDRSKEECHKLGRNIATLAVKLFR